MKELRTLIIEKAKNERLSNRQIGTEVGVAHSTISRIMKGKQVSIDTLVKVAEWLEVDASDLLPKDSNSDDLARSIAAIVNDVPELQEILQEAVDSMNRGEVHPETVREIVRYAAWRLSSGSSKRDGE